MRHLPTYFALAALAPVVLGAQMRADLVLVNGKIYTVDTTRPTASALAVRGGKILFVGSDVEARTLGSRSATVIDLGGRTVVPGIIDAHAHLLGLGDMLRRVNLAGSTSYDEVIARVKAFSKDVKPGEWILGRGWDQNRWPSKEFPTHDALSRAFPNNPVVLERVDGHAVLANAKAMELARVSAATVDPAGGRIIRLLRRRSVGSVRRQRAALIGRRSRHRRGLKLAWRSSPRSRKRNRWGLTGVHDAGASAETIGIYEELAKAGNYNLRNYVMLSDPGAPALRGRGVIRICDADHRALCTMDISGFARSNSTRTVRWDRAGQLSSRPTPTSPRIPDCSSPLLTTFGRRQPAALRSGFQVNIHAIGDRGNRIALDAIEWALGRVPRANHRFRIEHAQVVSPEDIPRFAKLGVIPSMQPTHQTSDMGWAEARVGPQRIRGAYAWRSLLNTGVIIPSGTDFPVEEVNPLLTFHAAVTRQDPNNLPPGGWYPEQKMTREEALQSMTIWAAYAGFQESVLGSLTPGKYADFVVLDRDIMRIPDTEILGTRVVSTWIGGKRVYEAK